MDNRTPTSKGPSFLDLPAELRDQIYEHVLPRGVEYRSGIFKNRIAYPGIIYVCRQSQTEASPIFAKNNTFRFVINSSPKNGAAVLTRLERRCTLLKDSRHLEINYTIFGLVKTSEWRTTRALSGELQVWFRNGVLQCEGDFSANFNDSEAIRKACAQLVPILEKVSAAVRDALVGDGGETMDRELVWKHMPTHGKGAQSSNNE